MPEPGWRCAASCGSVRARAWSLQFLVSIYGGYFGGAVGLMMMAAWSLLTANADLKAMAPARVLLVSATNGAAVVWFIAAGAVRWPETLAMLGRALPAAIWARG